MDSSNVLTALEELEKWRVRRVRIEGRLVALRSEREALEREVEEVGHQLSGLAGALFRPEERGGNTNLLPPFGLER